MRASLRMHSGCVPLHVRSGWQVLDEEPWIRCPGWHWNDTTLPTCGERRRHRGYARVFTFRINTRVTVNNQKKERKKKSAETRFALDILSGNLWSSRSFCCSEKQHLSEQRSGIISWCLRVGLLPGDKSSNKTYTLDEASPLDLTKSKSWNFASRLISDLQTHLLTSPLILHCVLMNSWAG